MASSVQPTDSEIGEGFAPISISCNTGPDNLHHTPFRRNSNKKKLGPPRASSDSGSSSILPPEASIQGGFAMDPGTKTRGLLSSAVKKIAKIFNL